LLVVYILLLVIHGHTNIKHCETRCVNFVSHNTKKLKRPTVDNSQTFGDEMCGSFLFSCNMLQPVSKLRAWLYSRGCWRCFVSRAPFRVWWNPRTPSQKNVFMRMQ